MSRKLKFVILILLASVSIGVAQSPTGRTSLYKRVQIIENGSKRSVNDDAHFITFTANGCYASDSQGIGAGGSLIKYVKDDRGFHCYRGNFGGMYADVIFSSDYRRINVRDDNTIYVYQREPGSQTTAALRSNGKNSGGSVVAVPVIDPLTSVSSGSSSGRSSTRRECPGCNGTGEGLNRIVYRHSYIANEPDEYCEECGKITFPHGHVHEKCKVCMGRKYIE